MSNRRFSLVVTALAGLVLVSWAPVVLGQTYFNPTAYPPGGSSASYLTTSDRTEQKLGSLLVGRSDVSPSSLCLNGPANCVQSWSSLGGSFGTGYVKVTSNALANPTVVAQYDAYQQSGYFHLRGNANQPSPTLALHPNTVSGATGLYADDGGDTSGYAGYFAGTVKVEQDSSLAHNPGQICLNDSANYPNSLISHGYGCIDQWSDIPGGAPAQYLKLLNPGTSPQSDASGHSAAVWMSRVLHVQGVAAGGALGVPPTFSQYCGDGICQADIGETVFTCGSDCGLVQGDGGGCDEGLNCDPGGIVP